MSIHICDDMHPQICFEAIPGDTECPICVTIIMRNTKYRQTKEIDQASIRNLQKMVERLESELEAAEAVK